MAQHFLSMYSVVILWCVVVLDEARVVSWNLQLLNPDLDVEPVEIVLLHLQLKIRETRAFEEDEPSCVLHVVVVRLRWDGDATMSARI